MKITDGNVEFNDREKRLFSLWRERFDRLPKDWTEDAIADPSGASSFQSVSKLLDFNCSMELVEQILNEFAERQDTPSVYQFKTEYYRRAGIRGKSGSDCAICRNAGILLVACEVTKAGTHLIKDTEPRACHSMVNTIPCQCERGRRHNTGLGAYTDAQLKAWVQYSFSEPCDCDRFVFACNRLRLEQSPGGMPPTQEQQETPT